MKITLTVILAVLALPALAGCAPHLHPRHSKTVVLTVEQEHHAKDILIVRSRPAASRHCRSHGDHWHCHN